MLLKAVTKTPQGKAGSQEWLVIHWGYTLLIFGFCGHLGLVGFQHVVYHLHLTAPHHVGTACYSTKMTLTRKYFKDSAFPTPSSYSVLLVLPKKKKSGKFWCSWNSWRGREKGSYCSELRWKAKALKTFKSLKSEGKKISGAYLCRGQSWLCILWMAPSSGLAGLSPITFWLRFLISK